MQLLRPTNYSLHSLPYNVYLNQGYTNFPY